MKNQTWYPLNTLTSFSFSLLFFLTLLMTNCVKEPDTVPEKPSSLWVKDGNYSVFERLIDTSRTQNLIINFIYRSGGGHDDYEMNFSYVFPEDISTTNFDSLNGITEKYLLIEEDGIYDSNGCGFFDLRKDLMFPNQPRSNQKWDWLKCNDEVFRSFQVDNPSTWITVPAGNFKVSVISDDWGNKYYYSKNNVFAKIVINTYSTSKLLSIDCANFSDVVKIVII